MSLLNKSIKNKSGQTAVEYLLLLGVVVAVVLIGFRTHLPRIYGSSQTYWNRVGKGILGDPNPCGDGMCCFGESFEACPVDCAPGTLQGSDAGCP